VINDDLLPFGAQLVSEQCLIHHSTQGQLPQRCRGEDTGTPPNFSWTRLLDMFNAMACNHTPCSNFLGFGSNPNGVFGTTSDALALQILEAIGTSMWYSGNARTMANAAMPVISNHCRTLPIDSYWNYTRDECYADAIEVLSQFNPQTVTHSLAWLDRISIHGISISPSYSTSTFGSNFSDAVIEYKECANWHIRKRNFCNGN